MAGLPIPIPLDEHFIGVPVPEDPPIDRDISIAALTQVLSTFFPANIAQAFAAEIANPPLPGWAGVLPAPMQAVILNMIKPSLSMKFYSTGNCNNPDGVRIEKVWGYLEGTINGSFRVAGIGIAFDLSAQPTAGGGHIIDPCPKNQGGPAKKIIKRIFHTVLMLKLTIQPGGQIISGLLDLQQPVIVNCCDKPPAKKTAKKRGQHRTTREE